MAGINDVYMKARGATKTKLNLVYAVFDALKNLEAMKVKAEFIEKSGMIGGRNE